MFDDSLLNNESITCINVLDKKTLYLKNEIPADDYSCFYHLAWAGTLGSSRTDYHVQLNNVKLTWEDIELCRDLDCNRIVYASSINEMETYEYLQSDNIEPSGGYIWRRGKISENGIYFYKLINT